MTFPVRLLLALAAGAGLYLTFPPRSLWWAAPLAVAALVLAVGTEPTQVGGRGSGVVGVRRAALLGYAGGLAFYVPLLTWISTAVGPLPWLLAAAGCALFWAALGVGLTVAVRLPYAPLAIAATWVVFEAMQSRIGFGGFPWGKVAFGQADSPFLRIAGIAGTAGVAFCVALLGGLLAAAVRAPVPQRRAVLATGVSALVLVPLIAAPENAASGADEATRDVTVALVQGNVPRLGLGFNAQAEAVLRNHVRATEKLAADVRAGRVPRPDLVLWPENAVDVDPFRHPDAYSMISRAAADIGAPLLVGAIVAGPTPQTRRNVAIVWDPVTGPGALYAKRRPAPFAEYLPMRPIATALSEKARLVGRDVVAGNKPGVLRVGPATVGVTICYELAFDGLVRDLTEGGAELLVLLNNSATFGRSAETHQQLAQARVRAVEHHRATLVVTTSGVSAVIAPDGGVERSTAIFRPEVVVAQVPLLTDRTLADRLGAWPEVLAAALLVGLVALSRKRRQASV